MASQQRKSNAPRRGRPATTPEGRESQIIAKAFDLAEKQIMDGSASAQTINHFLKRGSGRERLEMQRLERENELLQAKVAQLANAEQSEAIYIKALRAMSEYTGKELEDDGYD